MVAARKGKYNFIAFTDAGALLIEKLLVGISDDADDIAEDNSDDNCHPLKWEGTLADWTSQHFKQGNILFFIGAIGIAVRAIAPLCKDKTTDPAVLVIDEKGRFVIPVLSGHIGGAVDVAKELSGVIGATPVITTATDVRGEFAVDVFAKENDLGISDMKKAKEFTAKLLAGEEVSFTVTPKAHGDGRLKLIPKCTVIGMGCKRGKTFDELYSFLTEKLAEYGIEEKSLKVLVSVDKKKDEKGLIELSEKLGIPFITYSAEVLMEQEGDFDHSDLVLEVTGADNVCERAVAAYGCHKIIHKKTSRDGMTLAIGMVDVELGN